MKKYVIVWFVILVFVIVGAVGIYNDVKTVDTNGSEAIEISTPELQKVDFDFSFQLITLDNVGNVLRWGVVIVMGVVTFLMMKVYSFLEDDFN